MKPEEKFNELKNLILDAFKSISYCFTTVKDSPKDFTVFCIFSDGFSYIHYDKRDSTMIDVAVSIDILFYHNYVDLPSKDIVNIYLSKARMIETFDDYLSVFEELLDYRSIHEYVSETLYRFQDTKLVRIVMSDGSVTLRYSYHKGKDKIMHEISISRRYRLIWFRVYKNENRTLEEAVILYEIPEVFKSVIESSTKLYTLHDYLRYEEAIRKLIKLVNVKKRNIKDAVKELVEIYGYGDIFGY